MEMFDIPFEATDWRDVPGIDYPGETGTATWRTRQFGDIRVRVVDLTPGYVSDHWCLKGHVLYCLDGELDTELDDGRCVTLNAGMSFQVADNAERHRSRTATGARLFIVD